MCPWARALRVGGAPPGVAVQQCVVLFGICQKYAGDCSEHTLPEKRYVPLCRYLRAQEGVGITAAAGVESLRYWSAEIMGSICIVWDGSVCCIYTRTRPRQFTQRLREFLGWPQCHHCVKPRFGPKRWASDIRDSSTEHVATMMLVVVGCTTMSDIPAPRGPACAHQVCMPCVKSTTCSSASCHVSCGCSSCSPIGRCAYTSAGSWLAVDVQALGPHRGRHG